MSERSLEPVAEPAPSSDRRPSAPPTRGTRDFAQKRARATHAALIEASAKVFSELGFDAAQTPDIARAAGVSVGTFYRYFADKRQAFIEMIDAHLAQAYQQVMAEMTVEAFASTGIASRRAAVDRVMDILFANAATHPDLHRVFLGMSLRDDEVARIRTEYERRGREALAALIAQIVPRDRIADPIAAAEVIQIASQEVAIATVGGRDASPKSESARRALREELASMLTRYAFGDER